MGRIERVDNEGALAWAKSSSDYARSRGRERLALLVASVRAEIAFEMRPATNAGNAPLAGRAAGAW